jgi:signal transduction histidine kinase
LTLNPHGPESEGVPLPVYLESVSVNDQPLSIAARGPGGNERNVRTPVRLPMDMRALEIQFTALDLAAPEELRFRYKLEGLDEDWEGEVSERRARYGRLPYGQYQFRVAARRADGAWTEVATPFAFIVPTPLYLTQWAIGFYVITVIALVGGTVRVVSHRRLRHALARLEQQRSLERERMRIAQDMHDEMGSKLTKISFLSEHVKMDVVQAGPLAGKIESIAVTARDLLKTMDEIVWVVNPRNDSLENLAAYLSHHAAEYFQNTAIECEMKLPRAMPEHPLSSEARHNLFLAFEEALNNVLKHSGASRVKIEMLVNAADFEIMVNDNGRGFEAAPFAAAGPPRNGQGGRRGNGLRNLRQRLANIGGECVIHSQPGQGSTVTLRIRLNRATVSQT